MTKQERLHRLEHQARYAVLAQQIAGRLKDAGKLRWTADDLDCPDVMRLAALAEELGEVARCVHDGDTENLAVELQQLAGVAIAWAVVAAPRRRARRRYDPHVDYPERFKEGPI